MKTVSRTYYIAAAVLAVACVVIGFLLGWFLQKYTSPPGGDANGQLNTTSYFSLLRDAEPTITQKIVDEMKAANIEKNLRYLSSVPHVAGTNQDRLQAEYIQELWGQQGLDSTGISSYDVLLSYPGNGTRTSKVEVVDTTGAVHYRADPGREPGLSPGLENSQDYVPPYNAFSKSGVVQGEFAFAWHGTENDFHTLKTVYNETVVGKVVMVMYGWTGVGVKVKIAAQNGAVGVIICPDPSQVAPRRNEKDYPDGQWLPDNAVPRGTAHMTAGDLLTPGYPAQSFAYRENMREAAPYMAQLPVHSVSSGAAKKLLQLMDTGKSPMITLGKKRFKIAHNMTNETAKTKRVKLTVFNSKEVRATHNVFGVIRGSIEPDRLVILGNHRDAWVQGALDPASGTATLLEVTRVFGLLRKQGWQPRRTIIFASWGAEEFGLIGSTEWVQEKLDILKARAIAYLNVDIAVTGDTVFEAKASPLLAQAVFEATEKVPHPEPQKFKSVFHAWNNFTMEQYGASPIIYRLGMNSDFAAFYMYAGVPSAHIAYTSRRMSYPVYHTSLDIFDYVKKFVDPSFQYHSTVGKVWGELTRCLAESLLLPMNVTPYAESVRMIFTVFKRKLHEPNVKFFWSGKGQHFMTLFDQMTANFVDAAKMFQRRVATVDKTNPYAVRTLNDVIMLLEKAFLDPYWNEDRTSILQHVWASPNDRQVCLMLTCCPALNNALCDASRHLMPDNVPKDKLQRIHKEFSVVFHALSRASDILQAQS